MELLLVSVTVLVLQRAAVTGVSHGVGVGLGCLLLALV